LLLNVSIKFFILLRFKLLLLIITLQIYEDNLYLQTFEYVFLNYFSFNL